MMSDNEIIEIAKQRSIEFDSFCLINFVREREHGRMTIDDIIDEYGNLNVY